MNENYTIEQASPEVQRKFIAGVYFKMFFALVITGVVAFFTEDIYIYLCQQGIITLENYKIFMWCPLILELVLVLALSFAINKINPVLLTFCLSCTQFVRDFHFPLFSSSMKLLLSTKYLQYQQQCSSE